MKVLKFGGTSMANADSIRQVGNIVKADNKAKFIVVSAPGKRKNSDVKVTDLLYEAYAERENTGSCDNTIKKIHARFNEIVKELDIKLDISRYIEKIRQDVNTGSSRDYTASRGEYLSAIVFAAYMNYEFIDASELIQFDSFGNFDSELTNEITATRLKKAGKAIIPGFYGIMPNHQIKTFSRGGSDITGAIIARAVKAEIYENWTDVDGFMTCDPRIVANPSIIDVITYKEIRELSYMGASVLHPDSIAPVRKCDIPINIRNTFNPKAYGTFIVPSEKFIEGKYSRKESLITGIAGKSNFAGIFINKNMMNNEVGFMRRVLSVFEKFGVNIEHVPSGIDTLTVIFEKTGVSDETVKHIIEQIKWEVNPGKVQLVEGFALVAVVGHGMGGKRNILGRICSAISNADINIRMIDQGSSELNIIIAVDENNLNRAIKAVYDEFHS